MNKEKAIGAIGSVSGATSVLGSWQICHSICLGLIALLSVFGITIAGMPLLFLTKLAIPFWTAAVVLLAITFLLWLKKRCISTKLLLFNTGLIIAGIPFPGLQRFSPLFWAVGGTVALFAIILFLREKREQALQKQQKQQQKQKQQNQKNRNKREG